jgi:hypothetical protein
MKLNYGYWKEYPTHDSTKNQIPCTEHPWYVISLFFLKSVTDKKIMDMEHHIYIL